LYEKKCKIAPGTREKRDPLPELNQNSFIVFDEITNFKIVNMQIQIDQHKTQRFFLNIPKSKSVVRHQSIGTGVWLFL